MNRPALASSILFWLLFSLSAVSQPSWQWAEQYGGSSAGMRASAIAVDAAGHSHITGRFTGTATFDTVQLTSAGNSDVFVAKIDADGNLLWATSAGGQENVLGHDIAVDSAGNVFVTGSYAGSATFGSAMGPSQTITAPNGGAVFLAKYDSSGVFQWARSGGGASQYRDEAFAVATDAGGNAYITGYFIGPAEFGNLPPLTTAGWWDIFVVAYDASGNELWATSAGGSNSGWYAEAGRGIAVDSAGNVYVAGHFIGTAHFGSITLTALSPSAWPPQADMFLGRFNPVAGDWDWVVHGGGEGARANDLQIDGWGNLHVAGIFSGTGTIGNTTMTASPNRNSDYFVGKYDSSGTPQWVVQSGGTAFYNGHGIGLDAAGNVYLAATFEGTAQVGNDTLTAAGWDNIYVTKISPAGNFEWAVHAPAGYYHSATDVGADAAGNAFVTGWFQSGAAFGATQLSSPGTANGFVARLGDCDEWLLHCPSDFTIEECPAVAPDLTADVFIESECWTTNDLIVLQDPQPGSLLDEGLNLITLTVIAPNGEERICRVTVNVRCPVVECETDSVSLNTGFNNAAGGVYSTGATDHYWSVVEDPDPNAVTPRPANVVAPHQTWAPPQPGSQWIGVSPSLDQPFQDYYDLETTFCLGEGDWSGLQLELCLRSAGMAEVYLNGDLVGTTPNPAHNTGSPTCFLVNDLLSFVWGSNTLRVRIFNTTNDAIGLNLVATVTADNPVLEDPRCCHPAEPDCSWTLRCPGDIVIEDCPAEVPDLTGAIGIQSDCWSAGEFVVTQDPPAGTPLSDGQHPILVSALAPDGTLQECKVTVTVRCPEPNSPPEIECPDPVSALCTGPAGTSVTINVPVTDADGDALTYTWWINGVNVHSGSIPADGPPTAGTASLTFAFPSGPSGASLVVVDSAGNEVSCDIPVIIHDSEPPLVRCPQGIITLAAGDDCLAILPQLNVGVWDNCTPQSELLITQDPPSGTTLPPGLHTIVVTVIDLAGNQSHCRVQVRVQDRTPPTIVCPEPQSVEACEGGAPVPDFLAEATISSHCGSTDDLVVTQSPAPGTMVGPGTHAVTITVGDAAGNVASCSTSFTVTSPSATTDPIVLFNTGVDSSGNVLPVGTVDPHYEMVISPDPNFPGPDAVVYDSSWMMFNAPAIDSEWIALRTDITEENYVPGLYVFRTTFTLPAGMMNATISGQWRGGDEVRLNGVPVNSPAYTWGLNPWDRWFNITSGFVPGVNTLEFHTTGALRVELEGEVISCGSPCVSPHILHQPVSVMRPLGSTATFSVVAGGTGPLDYQWFHNDNLIPGATQSTLTISPVSLSDAGNYSVLVVNDCGEVMSNHARLRIRRVLDSVVGQWDFEPSRPLGATVGYDMEFVEAAGDGSAGNARFTTVFGTTVDFGLPGIDGRPSSVMRFSQTGPHFGYLVRADAPEPSHTFVFDLLLPEESVAPYPLFQTDGGNDGPADLYLGVSDNTQSGSASGDWNEQSRLRPNTWNRVAVTVDLEAARPVMTWFLNGERAGREFLSPEKVAAWEQVDGPRSLLLFTDGFEAQQVGFVSSIQWQNALLSDLEIAAFGRPSPGGIHSSSPYLLRPSVVLEPYRNSGELILYWIGEGFRLQETTDLQTWIDVDVTPTMEVIDGEIVHEVTLPIPDDDKRFYRVIED